MKLSTSCAEPGRKVAIVGPYLTHNFGDDLIGAVLVRSLQDRYGARVLLPHLRSDNRRWLGIPIVSSNLDALRKSQSVLIGGGGILGDSARTPNNRYLLPGALAALFSRITGRRVVVTAVGAGPLALPTSRILCRCICRLALAVGVRDQQSADFLVTELGVAAAKVISGVDVGVLWPRLLEIQPQRLDKIGVQFDVTAYTSAQSNPRLEDITNRLVHFYNERMEDVILVANTVAGTQLRRQFDFAPRSLQYGFMPSFLSRLAGLRAIVTSHLHLAIAAYAARIPCFSIYVREKTRRFYEQIEHPERALDIETSKPEEVQNLLSRVVEARWTDEDEARLGTLQDEASRLIEICRTLFGDDRS